MPSDCRIPAGREPFARMGQKTIEAMGEAFGTKPKDLCVCIGPSICRDCYEVSEDVADAFKEEFGAKSVGMIQHPVIMEWKSILMNRGEWQVPA
ncbi:MAG: laccase domain-containing protein [Clostridium fessum]